MAKLTRKSYKRKKIAFAAVILGGVALVSSGFAAWVLSSNAEKDVEGGVKVGTVEKGSLKIEISLAGAAASETGLNSGKFNFNTKKDDHTGRVRAAEGQTAEDSENLSLSYVVTVKSPIDNFKQLDITMTAKKENQPIVLDSAIKSGEKYYVNAPDCSKKKITLEADGASGSVTLANDKITSETEGSLFTKAENGTSKDETDNITYKYSWTTTYTVAFSWGDLFGEQNPGEYYDLEETKTTISDADVENTLNAMHTALDGISYTLNFLASVN